MRMGLPAMRLSTKGRYGLRLMTTLASCYQEGPVSADTLATSQDISAKYIHVLMTGLRSSGLVRTIRGPHGGYACARHPKTITALDILTVLEGEITFADCTTDDDQCSRRQQCATHHLWMDVTEKIRDILSQTTLADLVAKQQELSDRSAMYHI